MEKTDLEQLRYPIGNYESPKAITDGQLSKWITTLEDLPKRLRALVENLSKKQLDTPYRPGGWTVRQTVHHMADSHHHSYVRFKWALTEDSPIIKPYDEKGWSELFDAKSAPIALSLDHLGAVHAKLVYLLKGLSKEAFQTTFRHPDKKDKTILEENLGHYAWHGNHHYAHIAGLIEREGW